MFKNLSISRKLIGLSTLTSAAALLFASVAFLAYDQSSYRKILVDGVSAQARVIGMNSVSALVFNDPDSARETLAALEGSPNIRAASLFTADGRLFVSYSKSTEYLIRTAPKFFGDAGQTYVFYGNELFVRRRLLSGNTPVGFLVIRADLTLLRQRLTSFIGIAFAVLALSVFVAFLLSSVFQHTLTGAILALSNTARLVSRDRNYGVRAAPTGTNDELSLLVGAFNDMLAGIQARDAALHSERARLTTILESAPVGILVAEAASGKILLANRKFEEIVGVAIDTLSAVYRDVQILRPNRTLLLSEDRALTRALRVGEVTRGEEVIVLRQDGAETWVRASAAPVLDNSGHTVAAVLLLAEIDEQKRAQEALLRAEKLAAVGRLAASISHEINNPLESVTNLLFLAISDSGLSPQTRSFLQQAEEELARVTHIATQTLRFYRQTSHPTERDLGPMIDSVLQLLTGKLRNVQIEVVRDYRTSRPIICFEGELRQVFTNLISNAIDAMAGTSGILRLRTKLVCRSGKQGIQVSIADSGQGIPPQVSKRIFEPFYSTKGSLGTGLGLWVSREIVGKHKGAISVRSKSNVGTVFSVFLPFEGVANPATAGTAAAS